MCKAKKRNGIRRIGSMLLAVMLFAEPLNLLAEEMPAETGILTEGTIAETGIPAEEMPAETGIPAEEMPAETGIPAEETPAETGALQDQMLYFVNLYWETENLGEIEAVFDDGIQETEPVIQRMILKSWKGWGGILFIMIRGKIHLTGDPVLLMNQWKQYNIRWKAQIQGA